MSTLKTNAILDASGGTTATVNGYTPTESNMAGRNRIINGAMVIDQRNAGAPVTINSTTATYTVDRFLARGESADGVFTIEQDSSAPAGFTNSLKATVTTADASIGASQVYALSQVLEGFNVANLGFGTSNANTVTLSFWVRSSLTGTFGGSLKNDSTYSYPFTYTISSADTWEYKTVTITGQTAGTWATNNSAGMRLFWSLGCGSTYTTTANAWASGNFINATGATNVISTNGATFYITGVQLEKGSTATPFEYRPYGTELALCQRYYYRISGNLKRFSTGSNSSTTAAEYIVPFPTSMRTSPTAIETSGTTTDYRVIHNGTSTICSVVPTFSAAYPEGSQFTATVASGLTIGQASQIRFESANAYLGFPAEL